MFSSDRRRLQSYLGGPVMRQRDQDHGRQGLELVTLLDIIFIFQLVFGSVFQYLDFESYWN